MSVCVCVHCIYHGWQSSFHGCGNCCCWHNSALWFRSDFCCCILFTRSQFIDVWAFFFSSCCLHMANVTIAVAIAVASWQHSNCIVDSWNKLPISEDVRQDSICSGFNWISKLLFISWQQDLCPYSVCSVFRMLDMHRRHNYHLVLLAIKPISQLRAKLTARSSCQRSVCAIWQWFKSIDLPACCNSFSLSFLYMQLINYICCKVAKCN